jgi:hypothetical protein
VALPTAAARRRCLPADRLGDIWHFLCVKYVRAKRALPWPEFQGTLGVLEVMKAPAKAVVSAAGQ